MRHRIAACEYRPARLVGLPGPAKFAPCFLAHRQVEIGQDHRTLRKIGNHPQQPRERWGGTGHARGHDRSCRRRFAPFARRTFEQQIAPCGRVNLAPLVQPRPPALLNPGEQADGVLPVVRERADLVQHRIAQQIIRRDLFGEQSVHGGGQFAREAKQRGIGWQLPALGLHFGAQHPGQFEPAPRRFDRRRDVAGAERVDQRAQRLIEIEIAHQRHSRHQQAGPSALSRMPDKGLAHRTRSAAAGQQQCQPGKPELFIEIARDQPRNQCVGKSAMRGDRIDAWARAGPLSHASTPPLSVRSPAVCQPRTIHR